MASEPFRNALIADKGTQGDSMMPRKTNWDARIELNSPSTQYARFERLIENGSILVRSLIAPSSHYALFHLCKFSPFSFLWS
jgi:hypothetical protein